MPRPQKVKRIGRTPRFTRFGVRQDAKVDQQCINLLVEEYEALRLIDYNGLNQEECAQRMQVARATVQSLYNEARRKVARHLVEGTDLQITGGAYQLDQQKGKGEIQMRVAATYENGQIFQHFGRSEQFKIYEVEDGQIIKEEVVNTNGTGHGALAGFLKERGVDVLICGGIGGGAKMAMAEAGVQLFAGAAGSADEQVRSFIEGNLSYNPDTECHHHHEDGQGCGHHEGGHSCGGHCGQ